MNKLYNKTPEGTRDLLFEECYAYNTVKSKLNTLFKKHGYNEVVTPTLEYYDLFSLPSSGMAQEELYKLTGVNGKLLVLRPDITLPIARLAATRLKDMPLPFRLHYCERVFKVNPGLKGRSDEFMQSGIELIGAGGMLADLEVLATAANALKLTEIKDYKLEIGHVGIFNSLVAELAIDDTQKEEIRLNIESKNYAGLNLILDKLEQTPAVKGIRMLPRLFGGSEVFDEAAKLLGSVAAQPLDCLRRIWNNLEQLSLGEHIRVDLGLVQRNHYYTGVVFRGYIAGSGNTVLSGGRYDRLLSEFGLNLPATGFAVNINALAAVLSETNPADSRKEKTVLIFAKHGCEMKAIMRSHALCEDGVRCELMEYESDSNCREVVDLRGASDFEIIG